MTGPLAVGVDLGGTKVEVALVDSEGRVIASVRHPTGTDRTPAELVELIGACIGQVRAPAAGVPVTGIGLGVAGQVDSRRGVVLASPNLNWAGVALGPELRGVTGLPVLVTNDVRAATWGEWLYGAGRGVRDLVAVWVGTGVGGGIVSGGRILTGCAGLAGEFGHTRVSRRGPRCRCGGRGCLEAYAGGWAIARQAREAVARNSQAGAALLRLAGEAGAISAAHLSAAARAGDPLARRLLARVAEALAVGLTSVVNLINPCLVVLGGGVVEGLPELVGWVDRGLRRRALPAAAGVKVTRTVLGPHAGVVGAAALVLRTFGGRHEGD